MELANKDIFSFLFQVATNQRSIIFQLSFFLGFGSSVDKIDTLNHPGDLPSVCHDSYFLETHGATKYQISSRKFSKMFNNS